MLLKSDGYPTYHLANVVDDHLMHITHVIRGDEWLSSTPKHVILYTALQWNVPYFAHLPLLLKPDGSKLSKRHADASTEWYIEQGYLPQAILNFVALLGWSPPTHLNGREILTVKEMIELFDLNRVNSSGAIVNLTKLKWFNAQHLKLLVQNDLSQLQHLIQPVLHKKHEIAASSSSSVRHDLADIHYQHRIWACMVDHISLLHELVDNTTFFFTPPTVSTHNRILYNKMVLGQQVASTKKDKKDDSSMSCILTASQVRLIVDSTIHTFSHANTTFMAQDQHYVYELMKQAHQDIVNKHNELKNFNLKHYFNLLRFLYTATEHGPGLSAIISVMQQSRAIDRLKNFNIPTD